MYLKWKMGQTMNVYPLWFESNTQIGLPAHFDAGYLVSLVQNVNGGLQALHKGRWINVNLPPNSIFIDTGDHLEVNLLINYLVLYFYVHIHVHMYIYERVCELRL